MRNTFAQTITSALTTALLTLTGHTILYATGSGSSCCTSLPTHPALKTFPIQNTNLPGWQTPDTSTMQLAGVSTGTILVDYTDSDLPFQNPWFTFIFPMHSQIQCTDTILAGDTNMLRSNYYYIRFDTLYDAVSNQVITFPSSQCVTLELDSIFIAFSHVKPTTGLQGFNDTIVVEVYPVSNGTIDFNTVLYSASLITDTTLTQDTTLNDALFNVYVWAIDVPAGAVTVSYPDGIAIRLFLFGIHDQDTILDSTSALLPLVRIDDPCGGTCLFGPIPYEGMTGFRVSAPVSTLCNSFTAGQCNLFADCNNNLTPDPASCECLTFQLAAAVIYQYTAISIDADINDPDNWLTVCSGDTLTITAEPGFNNYTWGGNALINTSGNTAQVNPSVAPGTTDTFLVWVSAPATPSCTVSDTVYLIVENPILDADIYDADNWRPLCSGDTIAVFASSGFNNYVWSGPGILATLQNVAAVTYQVPPASADTFVIYVQANSTACQRTDSVAFIVERPFLDAHSLDPDNWLAVCNGDTITLTATPTNLPSYHWSGPGIIDTAGHLAQVSLSTPPGSMDTFQIYLDALVWATLLPTCPASDTVWLIVQNLLIDADTADPDNQFTMCTGDTLTLTATPGFSTYTWYGSALLNPNENTTQVHAVLMPGQTSTFTVWVVADSLNGCPTHDSAWITVIGLPVASFTVDSILQANQTVYLTNHSLLAESCQWDFGDGTTSQSCSVDSHTYSQPGTYTITLTVSNACGTDTFTTQIRVGDNPQGTRTSHQTPGTTRILTQGNHLIVLWTGWQPNYILVIDPLGRRIQQWTLPTYLTNQNQGKVVMTLPQSGIFYVIVGNASTQTRFIQTVSTLSTPNY